MKQLAEAAQADALLFIDAFDHISTGGRKALTVLGIFLTVATGIYVILPAGPAAVSAALVDSATGQILWYNFAGAGGSHDLRSPGDAADLVKRAFTGFPGPPVAKR